MFCLKKIHCIFRYIRGGGQTRCNFFEGVPYWAATFALKKSPNVSVGRDNASGSWDPAMWSRRCCWVAVGICVPISSSSSSMSAGFRPGGSGRWEDSTIGSLTQSQPTFLLCMKKLAGKVELSVRQNHAYVYTCLYKRQYRIYGARVQVYQWSSLPEINLDNKVFPWKIRLIYRSTMNLLIFFNSLMHSFQTFKTILMSQP